MFLRVKRLFLVKTQASLAGLAVFTILLGGCSSTTDEAPESAQSDTLSGTTDQFGAQLTVPEAPSLFEPYFSAYDQLGIKSIESYASVVARDSQVEESIVQCMKDQGFEYFPTEPLPEFDAESSTQSRQGLNVP